MTQSQRNTIRAAVADCGLADAVHPNGQKYPDGAFYNALALPRGSLTITAIDDVKARLRVAMMRNDLPYTMQDDPPWCDGAAFAIY